MGEVIHYSKELQMKKLSKSRVESILRSLESNKHISENIENHFYINDFKFIIGMKPINNSKIKISINQKNLTISMSYKDRVALMTLLPLNNKVLNDIILVMMNPSIEFNAKFTYLSSFYQYENVNLRMISKNINHTSNA